MGKLYLEFYLVCLLRNFIVSRVDNVQCHCGLEFGVYSWDLTGIYNLNLLNLVDMTYISYLVYVRHSA